MSDSTGAMITCKNCDQTDRVLFTNYQLTNLRDDHKYMVHSNNFMMSTANCGGDNYGSLFVICNDCGHSWIHASTVFNSLPVKVDDDCNDDEYDVDDFPNGFISWQQTHCEVSMLLQILDRDDEDKPMLLNQINHEGSTAYYTIAKKLTDEYEQLVNGFDYGQHEVMFDEAVEFFVYRRLGHQSVEREDLEKLS